MEDTKIKRWYDEDPIVLKCITMLENLLDYQKRQTATFLMEEIINKPPFSEMMPEEVFNLATAEARKRRWYDFDEVTRIFIELIRHASNELKRETALKALAFMDDLSAGNSDKSIEITIPEEEMYLDLKIDE